MDGTSLGNLLAPLMVMAGGLGLLYAGVQTAANAGVSKDQAGLAAALITTSFQLGSALGLAAFSGIATSRTSHLPAACTSPPEALTAGFQRALLVSALCLVAAGVIALRASNTCGEPAPHRKPRTVSKPPTSTHDATPRNPGKASNAVPGFASTSVFPRMEMSDIPRPRAPRQRHGRRRYGFVVSLIAAGLARLNPASPPPPATT